jgi:hypothetical protein
MNKTLFAAIAIGSLSVCNLFASDIIELPRMSMSEMAKQPVPFASAHQAREHERPELHRFASPFALNFPPAPNAISNIAPPHIVSSFRDTYDPPRAYPADAAGAVGPHHVLGVTNVWITIHDRSGTSLSGVFQEQFWSDTTGTIFDPRAYYDATADRFITTALIDTNLLNAYLLVAVSTSGDPTGTWRRFKIQASPTNNSSTDLDFGRLVTTSTNIVATARVYTGDVWSGAEVFILPKSDAYGSNAINATRVITTSMFDDLTPVDSDDAVTRVVATDSVSGQVLSVGEVSGTTINHKALWTGTFSVFDVPLGTQLGTTTFVDLSQIDFTNAFMRNGTLWTLEEVDGNAVLWKQSGSAPPTTTVISAQGGNVAYAFPSMAVTRDNAVLVAYAIFSSSAYISSGYTYIDPSGNVSVSTTIRSGEGAYRHDRWGDFTTTVVDPVDHTSFWTVAIYPMQHPTVTSQYVWATTWAHVAFGGSKTRAVRH